MIVETVCGEGAPGFGPLPRLAPDGLGGLDPVEILSEEELEQELRRLSRLQAQVEARAAEVVAEANRRPLPPGGVSVRLPPG